ncbi:MAG: oxidoreductase [Planctomycetota bacterium]|nr:MAG: oxidoreductase [Planctomycetota bacterium]
MDAPFQSSRTLKVLAAPDPGATRLAARLRESVEGDVRFDPLSRTIYATDASIYQIAPVGVVLPRHVGDVAATVRICAEEGVPIIPRGGGTGLAGGAVGHGVVLDFSRYMNQIGAIDAEARTVKVEPGVVLDHLNNRVAREGLFFAPDVATSSRATLGGMIANNSCGARSVRFGRTVDHVRELTVVLADGAVVTFRRPPAASGPPISARTSDPGAEDRTARLEDGLRGIRDGHAGEIAARFPTVLRSNGGYGLDRLGPVGTPIDATRILCGSEGTLAIVVGATLDLVPRPVHRALVILEFDDVLEALAATPDALAHRPSAVELVDRAILDATRGSPTYAPRRRFLRGDPAAILVVEFLSDSSEGVRETARAAFDDLQRRPQIRAASLLTDACEQDDVWTVRKAGLGLLMSTPGQEQSNSFVEDTAVPPERLREYIERFMRLLDEEGAPGAGYYAHASVGVIHIRPILDLRRAVDIEKMRRIADRVCDLAIEFGGTVTGEHGDGIVRSGFLERLYGPRIMSAFRQVKDLFDPRRLLNPGKIVDPWPMTENLRHGADYRETRIKTFFSYGAHGGPAGLAGMCSGVGECRKVGNGVMCPSYMATRDERDSTRARANALRSALSNRGLIRDLGDPALDDVLELCLSCKACKSECPTGVDVAKLKAEYLAQRHLLQGVPRRHRFLGSVARRLKTASAFPRLANAIAQSGWGRAYLERAFGLDRRIAPPRLAPRSFRRGFRERPREDGGGPKPEAALFIDTWTNFLHPEVGHAAVTLLKAAGYHIVCPPTPCCGRPLISEGLLGEAKLQAEQVLRVLVPLASRGVPIVGLEPSCVSCLLDEYPALISARMARTVASQTVSLETFLARVLEERPDALRFAAPEAPILHHVHCHQKALSGTEDVGALLQHAFADAASVIDAGCCGMAGAFGLIREHYDVSRTIAEDRLLPAIRSAPGAIISASGFSCRQQIAHHGGRRARHLAEVLAAALQPRA